MPSLKNNMMKSMSKTIKFIQLIHSKKLKIVCEKLNKNILNKNLRD